ncbi:MAG: cache domain-containing protein, partial [Pseudomonadota bacterium]
MWKSLTRSLAGKLILFFTAVSLVAVIMIGYLSFTNAEQFIFAFETEKLAAARNDRIRELTDFFDETIFDVQFLSSLAEVREALASIQGDQSQKDGGPGPSAGAGSELYRKMEARTGNTLDRWLKTYETKNGFHDVILVTADGHVPYTVKKESELGEILGTGKLKDTGLGRAWNTVMKMGKMTFTDFGIYGPSAVPAAFVGAPVQNQDGRVLGVLVVRIGMEAINGIFSQTQELGKTAEAYIVGEDHLMRSNSRFEKDSLLRLKVDTEAVKGAFSGRSETRIIRDYRNTFVLSSFCKVGIREKKELGADFEWA